MICIYYFTLDYYLKVNKESKLYEKMKKNWEIKKIYQWKIKIIIEYSLEKYWNKIYIKIDIIIKMK